MNSLVAKVIAGIKRKMSDYRWKSHLKEYEKKIEQPLRQLTQSQIKEIKDYYSSFGFKTIKIDWHQYIYSVVGVFSPKFLPEDFFHGVLENAYNKKNFYCAWEDKAFMPYILNTVKFPETICCNVNGYYFDKNRKIISKEVAENLVKECGDAFAKPTLASGMGRSASLVSKENVSVIFDKLGKNFIVQKRIIQSSETASFNPSSVNTEKIVSFMFNGKVYILSAIMRVGAENSITDAAGSGKGYFFGINENGKVEDCGINLFGKKRDVDFYGNPIKGRIISHHKEICEIVKNAHKYFPYFGFMSWDFCINNNDEILLIEYNTGYPIALVYQIAHRQPLLGDLSEEVLKDVANKI